MKSISSSYYLTSVYTAWSGFGERTILFPFDNQPITTMNIVFGKFGRLFLSVVRVCSPKSVTNCLLPRLPFSLTFSISLAHFFRNISTHCRPINLALSKLSKGNHVSNVSKISVTAVSPCRGQSLSYFNQLCPWIIDQYFSSVNAATHHFFHLLNVL